VASAARGQAPAADAMPAVAASQPAGPQPKLEYAPRKFDFGELWVGMPAKIEITLKNVGEADLHASASADCGCTVVSQPQSPLAPGAACKISIAYDTKRLGAVNKHVTLTTDDPAQRQVSIAVTGTVKPPYESKPPTQLNFGAVLTDENAERTVRMENKFGRPLKLKLKAGQDFGRFEVTMTEVEPGQVYELKAQTIPPLAVGYTRAEVVLETDAPEIPTLTVPVSATAQPRVSVNPSSVFVSPAASQPSQQTITVQYRLDAPLEITEARSSVSAIKAEVMPARRTGDKVGFCMVRVSLPAVDEIPDGATVEILTTDKGDYQRLVVPIVKRLAPPVSGAGGASTGGPHVPGVPASRAATP